MLVQICPFDPFRAQAATDNLSSPALQGVMRLAGRGGNDVLLDWNRFSHGCRHVGFQRLPEASARWSSRGGSFACQARTGDRAEERFADAESLCQEAITIRHNHAQLYLNLAEVYHCAGRPQEAIEVLEKGLVSAGRDFRIRRALEKIGTRREPVVSFLHRSHPLNRTLGRWRHRLSGPPQAA
jgi:tetratricopeptide (TPR) repeat protein